METNLLRVSRRVHPRRVSETAAGWAFFNINGYLGTVTPEGEVVFEETFEDDEDR